MPVEAPEGYMKNNRPQYLNEIETFMSDKNTFPLKDLFVKFRRSHPEIMSMRTLKEDIETHLTDVSVNAKDMVINKDLLMKNMLGIAKAN